MRSLLPRSHRFALTSLALLALAACGPSEQEKRLKALAGTYVRDTETDPNTDPAHARIHQRQELTLKADGTWRMSRFAEMNGRPIVSDSDAGRFGVNGSTLNVHSEGAGLMQYTASGDTLWIRAGRMVAVTKAVTGIDMQGEESYLLRQR